MIKIIKGIYGYMDKRGIVRPKTEHDDPFELTEEQEERLVKLGIAVYVDGGRTALPDDVRGVPEYSAEMKADELREIAKEHMGLTFKVGTTKAEMVAEMDKYLAENTVDSEDEAENDTGEAEDDGEQPPAFDPAEAVE